METIGHEDIDVVTNHGDEVTGMWPGACAVASTTGNRFAAAEDPARGIVAVQPHFEISKEKVRNAFFKDFRNWTKFNAREEFGPEVMQEYISADLRQNYPLAPGKKAMVALSGGVDSTTVAAAAIRHYGRGNVVLTFVNTGLLRRDYPAAPDKDFGRETDRLLQLMRA